MVLLVVVAVGSIVGDVVGSFPASFLVNLLLLLVVGGVGSLVGLVVAVTVLLLFVFATPLLLYPGAPTVVCSRRPIFSEAVAFRFASTDNSM